MAKSQTVDLMEMVYNDGNKIEVDREAGYIRGVKILGRNSKHGRNYSDRALDDAVRLYEGMDVCEDHPPKEKAGMSRPIRDTLAYVENPQRRKDGVYGDLALLKSHPSYNVTMERAERFPQRFGLSHNAHGNLVYRSGQPIVESLEVVRSVDIVRRPATNANLMEGDDDMSKKTRTVEDVISSLPRKSEDRKLFMAMLEEMDGETADTVMAAPVESTGDSSADIKAAFRKMVIAAFDDESLDAKATLKKIKDILKAQEKLMGGGSSSSESAASEPAAEPVQESTDEVAELRKDLARMKDEKALRHLLESEDIEHDDDLVESLLDTSVAARKSLIKRLPKKGKEPVRPRRTGSVLQESVEDTEVSSDPKEFAASLRSPF